MDHPTDSDGVGRNHHTADTRDPSSYFRWPWRKACRSLSKHGCLRQSKPDPETRSERKNGQEEVGREAAHRGHAYKAMPLPREVSLDDALADLEPHEE